MYKTDYERSLDQASILLIQTLTDKIKKLMAEDGHNGDILHELVKHSQQLAVECRLLYGRCKEANSKDEAKTRLWELGYRCEQEGSCVRIELPLLLPKRGADVSFITEPLHDLLSLEDSCERFKDCTVLFLHIYGGEKKDVRGSDQLKYSRFVGIWKKADGCSVVYDFGRKNVQLNRNGERNARQVAKLFHHKVNRLILGDNMDTLLSVLRYSQWVNAKTDKQRRHVRQLHFHVDLNSRADDDIHFLPVSRDSMPVLNMMQNVGWEQWIQGLRECFAQDGVSVWMALDCRVKPLLENLMHPSRTREDTVLIVCYDWQEGFIREFYSDINDRKEIGVQTVKTEDVVDFFSGKSGCFACGENPYRL